MRSHRFVVAIDIDSVLGDAEAHVLARANAEFGIHMAPSDLHVWNQKIGPSSFTVLIERYLKDPEWIMTMPIIEGSREGVAFIREGADVIIATTTVKETESVRAAWIRKNYGFNPVIVNTWDTGKASVPADVLIDDYVKNIMVFLNAAPNRTGIILDPRGNHDAPLSPRMLIAKSWAEIVDLFKNEAALKGPAT